MNYDNPKLRDRLAAEYALGTLRGPARRRFQRLLSNDGQLRDLTHDWELRVNLLSESAPAVEPPPHLWEAIAQRIAPNSLPVHESWLNRLWDSIAFWRGFSALAAAAAALLVVVLQAPDAGRQQIAGVDERLARIEAEIRGVAEAPGKMAAISDRLAGIESRLNAVAPAPSHVAVLLDMYRRPMMNADLDITKGRLALRLNIKPPRNFTGKTLEVWLVPSDGTPRSLGLFPSEKSGTTTVFVLSRDVAEALASGSLAVSLEPAGGSTTGAPSGPILFSGPVIAVDV